MAGPGIAELMEFKPGARFLDSRSCFIPATNQTMATETVSQKHTLDFALRYWIISIEKEKEETP